MKQPDSFSESSGVAGPLRVAHVIPDGKVGGAQEYLASLAGEQRRLGMAPLILTADHGPFVQRYREAAPVMILPVLDAYVEPWSNLRAIVSLCRTLRNHHVELIHGHTSRGLIYAAVLRDFLRKPAIASAHGFVSAHALMTRAAACIVTWIKRLAATRLDGITVAAEAVRDLAVQVGVPREKLHVVYAGIDATRFHPGNGARNGPVRIGAAGRLISIKGFRFYIEAACALLAEGLDVEFVLYGDGPEESRLRAMVASAGYTGKIQFYSFQENFDELLRGWDIAVVPSVVDSFPFLVLEAMATGVPVVASAVGGIPEALQDGIDGFLVPPSDAPAIAAAVRRLSTNFPLRAQLGASALATCRHRFVWHEVALQYGRLYNRVLGRDGPIPS